MVKIRILLEGELPEELTRLDIEAGTNTFDRPV